jgi:hypothetical protein
MADEVGNRYTCVQLVSGLQLVIFDGTGYGTRYAIVKQISSLPVRAECGVRTSFKVSRFYISQIARSNCDIRQIMYPGDVRVVTELFNLLSQFDSKLRDWLQIARYLGTRFQIVRYFFKHPVPE